MAGRPSSTSGYTSADYWPRAGPPGSSVEPSPQAVSHPATGCRTLGIGPSGRGGYPHPLAALRRTRTTRYSGQLDSPLPNQRASEWRSSLADASGLHRGCSTSQEFTKSICRIFASGGDRDVFEPHQGFPSPAHLV